MAHTAAMSGRTSRILSLALGGLGAVLFGVFLAASAAKAAAPPEGDAPPAEESPASEPLRFDGLRWSGLDKGPLYDNLRRRVSLARLKLGTGLRPERFDYFLRILPREVDEALAPFGYYRVALEILPTRTASALAAEVRIELGKPVTIAEQRIAVSGPGGNDLHLRRAIADFRPREGEPLLHQAYENSKAEIDRLLVERGYFDARKARARVDVHRREGRATIDLHWHSGSRYRFGEANLRGHPFRPGLLEPLVPFRPEQPFQQARLLELQRRLTDLDYFKRIDVQPTSRPEDASPAEAGSKAAIGIDVDLEAAPRNVYRAGASYGTDTGLAIKLGYSRRWLNIHGHKLDADAVFGEQRSLGLLRYRIPAFARYTGWWTATLAVRDERFGALRTDTVEASLLRDAQWRGNLFSAGVFLHREQFAGLGETLLYPQLSAERSVSNDPLYPTRGFRWKLLGRWGSRALGSDVDFRQWIASASVVRGLGERNRLILRLEAGSTQTSSFERLPPSLRFYAGGDRSVRGYGYQELGPLFEGDQRVGGKRLLVGSVEFERMFTAQWGGAVFVDAGNAFNSRFDAALGFGVGLRWRSPVGPVRVDIGHGLDEPDQVFRLHIQLGPEL